MKNFSYFILLALSFCLFSCANEQDDTQLNYDQSAFLKNTAENIIIPRYQQFQSTLNDLQIKADTFSNNPTTTNLQTLKTSFLASYQKFQYVVFFDFGPAEGSKNINTFNIYPSNTTTIENNISTGSYDFGAANQLDSKGFPAIDYLLYHSDENTVINEFKEEKRKTYLKELVKLMNLQIDEITTTWQSSYKTTFITTKGNSSGTSLSLLLNQFNFSFEDFKNYKIGTASGARSSLGTTFPDKVEAYYSQHSLALAKAHLQSLKEIYLGISTQNIDGIGFDDYLIGLEKPDLNNRILAKITALENMLKDFETIENGIFSKIIENNNTKMIDAFNLCTSFSPLIKSELPSLLSVAITYQDGDGD